ncbi:hypothetical protein AAY473_017657 [Plecturocebus cupreus]
MSHSTQPVLTFKKAPAQPQFSKSTLPFSYRVENLFLHWNGREIEPFQQMKKKLPLLNEISVAD